MKGRRARAGAPQQLAMTRFLLAGATARIPNVKMKQLQQPHLLGLQILQPQIPQQQLQTPHQMQISKGVYPVLFRVSCQAPWVVLELIYLAALSLSLMQAALSRAAFVTSLVDLVLK